MWIDILADILADIGLISGLREAGDSIEDLQQQNAEKDRRIEALKKRVTRLLVEAREREQIANNYQCPQCGLSVAFQKQSGQKRQ